MPTDIMYCALDGFATRLLHSLRLSVSNSSRPGERIFTKFDILQKYIDIFQFRLKWDNDVHLSKKVARWGIPRLPCSLWLQSLSQVYPVDLISLVSLGPFVKFKFW